MVSVVSPIDHALHPRSALLFRQEVAIRLPVFNSFKNKYFKRTGFEPAVALTPIRANRQDVFTTILYLLRARQAGFKFSVTFTENCVYPVSPPFEVLRVLKVRRIAAAIHENRSYMNSAAAEVSPSTFPKSFATSSMVYCPPRASPSAIF